MTAIFTYLVINENTVSQQFHETRTIGKSRRGRGREKREGRGREGKKTQKAETQFCIEQREFKS